MPIQDQVVTRVEPPRHVRRFLLRRRALLPEQEMRVRIEFAGHFSFDVHAAGSPLGLANAGTPPILNSPAPGGLVRGKEQIRLRPGGSGCYAAKPAELAFRRL
jgi:hypothetical protein